MRLPALVLAVAVLVVPVHAQNTPVAPPPKPAGAPSAASGPTLEQTLNYIADKINYNQKVTYAETMQKAAAGYNESWWETRVQTGARGDATACTVTWHGDLITTPPSKGSGGEGHFLNLKTARDVQVMPFEQFELADLNSFALAGGSPITALSISPSVAVVAVRGLHNSPSEVIWFTDADTADRVAKAITHAIELCGGGQKELF